MRLSIEACSNKGCVRSNNEDNLYINGKILQKKKVNDDFLHSCVIDQEQQLFAVCDGMGGTDFGEVASMAAVSELAEMHKELEKLTFDKEWFSSSIHKLSQKVYHSLRGKSSAAYGGTTIAGVCIDNHRFIAYNVGDSRVYLFRRNKLYQLSKDHTEVQRMVDLGFLTPAEAAVHPQKHVITKHLGMAPEYGDVEANQSRWYRLRRKDVLLLCSDGLHDMLNDHQIQSTLLDGGRAFQLVDSALAAGGFDNVTVITIQMDQAKSKAFPFFRKRRHLK